jgi:hypothetical protein
MWDYLRSMTTILPITFQVFALLLSLLPLQFLLFIFFLVALIPQIISPSFFYVSLGNIITKLEEQENNPTLAN